MGFPLVLHTLCISHEFLLLNFLSHAFCKTENGVIIVQSVLYGRTDAETCSVGRPAEQLKNTQCSQDGALKVVKSRYTNLSTLYQSLIDHFNPPLSPCRCDGQKVCEINANLFSTSDPCYGIYKYVDTTYACFPASKLHL